MQSLIELLKQRTGECDTRRLLSFEKITLINGIKAYVLKFNGEYELRTDSELVFKQLSKITFVDLPLEVCLGEVEYNGKKQLTLIFPFC